MNCAPLTTGKQWLLKSSLKDHNLQHCYQMEFVNEYHGDPVIFSAVLSLHMRNLKALWIPQVSSENVPSKKITSSQLQQGKETVLNYKSQLLKYVSYGVKLNLMFHKFLLILQMAIIQ